MSKKKLIPRCLNPAGPIEHSNLQKVKKLIAKRINDRIHGDVMHGGTSEVKSKPTREEYITSKIDSTINAALDKSRTRKYPSSPLILDNSNTTDTELHVTNSQIDAYSDAAAAAANKGNYEDYYKFMNKAAHYAKRRNYLQNLKDRGLCEGNSCIYTTTDNYGEQYKAASNVEFAKDPNKYGFIKIDTANRKIGDLQQRVIDYNNHPYHMMMLNGIDENGLARYNYSAGGNDEGSIRVNAKYPLEEGEHIDTYRFVGTPADSVKWTKQYFEEYPVEIPMVIMEDALNEPDKKKCGGRLIPKHAKGNPVNTNPLPKMPINTNPVPKKEDKKKLFKIDLRVVGNIPPLYLTFPNVNGKGLYMIKKK